jgi:hypothetical protein
MYRLLAWLIDLTDWNLRWKAGDFYGRRIGLPRGYGIRNQRLGG